MLTSCYRPRPSTFVTIYLEFVSTTAQFWQMETASARPHAPKPAGYSGFLVRLRPFFRCLFALYVLVAIAASLGAASASCSEGARSFFPCELNFDWHDSELPPNPAPYQDELLRVEFRSPTHTTYLVRAFWDGGHTLRVRFTPTEAGTWTYRIASSIKRYDNRESTFNVAESGAPGFVDVANLRHWRTTNKQPQLWLAAAVPLMNIDQPVLESWLDLRKHDGFTHVRATLLTSSASAKPLTPDGQPNLSYFATLDDRVLAAINRGFTVDLLLADDAFVQSGALNSASSREPLIRYLIARYAGLNVTWQGVEHFEDIPGAHGLLKETASILHEFDPFQHPRSSDARVSSWPLLVDGWENYLIEASPHPEVGAVEHQFNSMPAIHVITTAEPDAFRHELWNCTTNGDYPSVSYEALQNPVNVKAVQTWFKIVSDTRHWEFEPYFDVSGARAVGLEEIGFIAYAQTPGIVEITLPKHKYNPVWINPSSGEETPMKDYRGEIFSQPTPDNAHDWILDCEREGHKESMLRSVRFESVDAPVQEVETDAAKIPFEIVDPPGDTVLAGIPTPFRIKLTKNNRGTRYMQLVWWGGIVAGDASTRLLAVGASGNFSVPPAWIVQPEEELVIILHAINANGKAYEIDKTYKLSR